jgi:hypothetical protein
VNGPTTSKRSIESNVLVDDGSIIVLGGLLEDSYQQAEDKVPLMGDIPVLGNLFRSENRSRKKTNLMVFLRPVVVRDAAASDALMLDRYDAIRALQQVAQPAPSAVMGSVRAPRCCPRCAPKPLCPHRFTPPRPSAARPSQRPEQPRHAPPPALRLCRAPPSCCWRTTASSWCCGTAPSPTPRAVAKCCASTPCSSCCRLMPMAGPAHQRGLCAGRIAAPPPW